jgi:MFS family permease
MAAGPLEKARGALAGADFRKLFTLRLLSQSCDGLFQASLVASLVFSPDNQDTAAGFFRATLIIALPFTLIGPFAGVFIDRWRRRRILQISPLAKAAAAMLVLVQPGHAGIAFYGGALLALSINRFFLTTTNAVVPRLVASRHLLMANSIATVGGTVSFLTGVFVGGKVVEATGESAVVIAAAAGWFVVAVIATRLGSDLRPHKPVASVEGIGREIARVVADLAEGARRLVGAPRAIGPISSITLDQVGQGVLLTLSLVVFRTRFEGGVGSFSNLVGFGGLGVLTGILTAGWLEQRFRKERIVAGAFLFGGLVTCAVASHIVGWTILVASYVTGLTFAWKKVAVDTLVQEALPDGYRGRVFAIYDIAYNMARVVAGAIAVGLFPGDDPSALREAGSLIAIGAVFALYTPILPAWIGRVPEVRLRFTEGAKAEEWPRTIDWGGVEETVEVVRSGVVERDGVRLRAFRLSLADGSTVEVERPEPDGDWRIVREAED